MIAQTHYGGEYYQDEEVKNIHLGTKGIFKKWTYNSFAEVTVDDRTYYIWWEHFRNYWHPINKHFPNYESERNYDDGK